MKALCFSNAKRNILLEHQSNLSPVRITNYVTGKSWEDKAKDIIKLNDITTIQTAEASDIDFQYRADPSLKFTALEELKRNIQCGQLVNVKGKVTKGGKVEVVGQNNLRMMKCAIDDGTAVMELLIWQNEIEELEDKRVYTFEDIRVRSQNGAKVICTTKRTQKQMKQNDELEHLDNAQSASLLKEQHMVQCKTVQNFRSVVISKGVSCIQCRRKLQIEVSSKIVKCDRCSHRMRLSDCTVSFVADVSIQIQNEQEEAEIKQLTAFTDTLSKTFNTTVPLSSLSEDRVGRNVVRTQRLLHKLQLC